MKRRTPDYSSVASADARPAARASANVILSFSDLKYFFECPYQFKLRILYGSIARSKRPRLRKSLHDALAEVHARVHPRRAGRCQGGAASGTDAPARAYAYPDLEARQLEAAAEKGLRNYLDANQALFDKIEFSEKPIEIALGDGVSVNGRIDLVRQQRHGEMTIVDLKSNDRAQAEEVTETQLHIYALGYQELTGRRADYVEIYELDEGSASPVRWTMISSPSSAKVVRAANALRTNTCPLHRLSKCRGCDYRGMCSPGIGHRHKGAAKM